MASKAQSALSANLAALSYAMDLANGSEAPGFNIGVSSGKRVGPLEQRRQDPEYASPDVMSLEFEKGKPLKNFGRLLASQAGIPLPYNFRQSAEAAEQARIDYENDNTYFGDMADTFLEEQMDRAAYSSTETMRRQHEQYAAQGRDAIAAFFAEGASPQQRQAAAQRFAAIRDGAQRAYDGWATNDANERQKIALEQYKSSSAEILGVRSALSNATLDYARYKEGVAALQGTPATSKVVQSFYASQIGRIANAQDPFAKLLGAAGGTMAEMAAAVLSAGGGNINPEDADKLISAYYRAGQEHGNQLLGGLVQSHQQVLDENKNLLGGLPSWTTTDYTLPEVRDVKPQHSLDVVDSQAVRTLRESGGDRIGGAIGDVLGQLLYGGSGVEFAEPPPERGAVPQLNNEGRGAGRGLGGRRPTR